MLRPLKNKTGVEVTKAMSSIIEEIGTPPKNIHSDQGKEFFSKDFEKLMEKYKINFYNTLTHLKASICERFNRTLITKMLKMFSLNGNYKWVKRIASPLIQKLNKVKIADEGKVNVSSYPRTPLTQAQTKRQKRIEAIRDIKNSKIRIKMQNLLKWKAIYISVNLNSNRKDV